MDRNFLKGLAVGFGAILLLGMGPLILAEGAIKFWDTTSNAYITPSTTDPLPVSASISGGTPPGTVFSGSVSCGTGATQLPAQAVESGYQCCVSQPSGTSEGLQVGSASVTTTTGAHIPATAGALYCQAVGNCNELYCLVQDGAGSQTVGVQAEGD